MSNIKAIEPPAFHNIADSLVTIAKQLTAGEFDNVATAVVILRNTDNTIHVCGLGPSDEDTAITTMVLGIDHLKGILK